jgi:hypothetical protein
MLLLLSADVTEHVRTDIQTTANAVAAEGRILLLQTGLAEIILLAHELSGRAHAEVKSRRSLRVKIDEQGALAGLRKAKGKLTESAVLSTPPLTL